jgi:hypothetical protein
MVMKRDERAWHLTVRAGSGLDHNLEQATGNYSAPSQLNFLM